MIDRIRTPLDYAREVLGRLPSQGVRLDILVAAGELQPGELQALTRQRAIPQADGVPALVEGEFEWL